MIQEEYRLNNGALLQIYESRIADGPLLLIAPGGGYFTLTDNEGECVAEKFSEDGFRCAVLRYATADTQDPCGAAIALEDMSAAVRLIREKDADSPFFTLGFSAGGHLCASFANTWKEEEDKYELPHGSLKPAGTVLCYPALSFRKILHRPQPGELPEEMLNKVTGFQKLVRKGLFGSEDSDMDPEDFNVIEKVNPNTPPSFVWGTMEDELIDPASLYEYQAALQRQGTECQLIMFEKGSHGLSLATRQSAMNESMINDDVAAWAKAARQWIKGRSV